MVGCVDLVKYTFCRHVLKLRFQKRFCFIICLNKRFEWKNWCAHWYLVRTWELPVLWHFYANTGKDRKNLRIKSEQRIETGTKVRPLMTIWIQFISIVYHNSLKIITVFILFKTHKTNSQYHKMIFRISLFTLTFLKTSQLLDEDNDL